MPQAEPQISKTSIPDMMTKRHQFMTASKRGDKGVASSVILQLMRRQDENPPRYGITASKKIGNAVIRNRAKRRLREVVRMALGPQAQHGYDYVLIARHNTATIAWDRLLGDFNKALSRAQDPHKENDRKTNKGQFPKTTSFKKNDGGQSS